MSVLNIRKAVREGARLVIGLAGISGSGKTYTALQVAYGLANFDASKVGLLDTENRRGSLYAKALTKPDGTVDPFLIGDLYAPFSPQRYVDAILEFQAAGVEVLVIDSTSHEWEGVGGCEDIAHSGGRLPDWKTAKREHKRFMNIALACNMHIIFCIRAREKVDMRDTRNIQSLGIQPICEKNMMFEMTASMMMWDEGKTQDVLKCPEELRAILGRGQGYLTSGDGKALRDWVDGGQAIDPAVEQARNTLRTVTEQGMDALVAAWTALPKEIKAAIGPSGCPDEFKRAAQEFDAQRSRDGKQEVADLNSEILGDAAQGSAGGESGE